MQNVCTLRNKNNDGNLKLKLESFVWRTLRENRCEMGFFYSVNGKLWASLIGVVGLQVVVVHWSPAQAIFSSVDLSLSDWGLAGLVAASVLLLEEARKLAVRCCSNRG